MREALFWQKWHKPFQLLSLLRPAPLVLLVGIMLSSLNCTRQEPGGAPLDKTTDQLEQTAGAQSQPGGSSCLGLGPETNDAGLCKPEERTAVKVEPPQALNVLGDKLELCSTNPVTGWFRDGYCRTDAKDHGSHTVCAQMNEVFLRFTREQGNDLSTPRPASRFVGLKPGDRWCLCSARWLEAQKAGAAPKVVLTASHSSSLKVVELKQLKQLNTTTK